MPYPWYELVDAESGLQQGDFISDCPVVVPPTGDGTEVVINEYDVVIMSQSCDLENGKLEIVLVCPVWPLSEFEKSSDFFKSKNGKEALRKGNVPGYHLLNRCDIKGFERDISVVDFRTVYGVDYPFLIGLCKAMGPQLRLLPPYREHLSQSFARFFMRVGLPVDIPSFTG